MSANRAARCCSVCHCLRCTVLVAMPMRIMKIGISGSVITAVKPLGQSCHHITTTITGVAMTVSTSCGRYFAKYWSNASSPWPAVTASDARLRDASHPGPSRPIAPISARRSCVPVAAAARIPAKSDAAIRMPRSSASPSIHPSDDATERPARAPVTASVRNQANAMTTAVWSTPMTAARTKNPRAAPAYFRRRGSTGFTRGPALPRSTRG